MDNLIATLIAAFILILASLALLGIGWLITGKSKIKPGACGKLPNQKKDKSCGEKSSCDLCEKNKTGIDQKM